jgi:hypothetical protein
MARPPQTRPSLPTRAFPVRTRIPEPPQVRLLRKRALALPVGSREGRYL